MDVNIESLQAKNLPVAKAESVIKISFTDEGKNTEQAWKKKERFVKFLDKYFESFIDSKTCPNCDSELGGFFGMFQYGMAWGEGHCGKCGYPCRADHKVEDEEFKFSFSMVLPYHPSVLKKEG